jgi:hypothetical protein
MKTQWIVCLALNLSIAITGWSAPNNNDQDTRSEPWSFFIEDWQQPVYCADDELIDFLVGYEDVYLVTHYRDGTPVWVGYHATGELTSQITGEVFKVLDNDWKQSYEIPAVTFRMNLIGDKGNHYLITQTWTVLSFDPEVVVITYGRTFCLPNAKP